MPELPGCPFCGSRRVELLPNFGNRVVCNDCTAEAHIDDWKQRVISGQLIDTIHTSVVKALSRTWLTQDKTWLHEMFMRAGYTILMDYGGSE